MVLPQMTRDGLIEACIVDDIGIPKNGQHTGPAKRSNSSIAVSI